MSNRAGVDDLVSQIDAYLAEQLAYSSSPSRPTSRGTMFVDWEGYGDPIVSYRHHRPARRLCPQPLLVADMGLEVRYQRPSSRHVGGVFVEGFDAETGFEYDYDGRVMHIHRDALPPSPTYSDYYAIDARSYESDRQLLVVDKELPPQPHKERRKRGRVVTFIQKLLKKLDGMGLMKRLTADGKKASARPSARPSRRQKSRTPARLMRMVPRTWVASGYVT